MQEVLVAGSGQIGSLIATLLAQTVDYHVHIADLDPQTSSLKDIDNKSAKLDHVVLDVTNKNLLSTYVTQNNIKAIISCLPYFYNLTVAQIAQEHNLHYFDLTEDTQVAAQIKMLSENAANAFVPQCGLAPGFISIITSELMKKFDKVDKALMRVGALPENPNNSLKYALTWSTDGLINEYANPCEGIEHGKPVPLQPLEGLETIEIDGLLYEAFNTSGGLSTLAQTHTNKVQTMNYKTLRYPGHCEKIRFLMNELKLSEDRPTLKKILEHALPRTHQDVVIIYVAVTGYQNNHLFEETYAKKIYPITIAGKTWSAIQITTAASACAVVDIVLQNLNKYHGLILQENFEYAEFINNRFGKHYL